MHDMIVNSSHTLTSNDANDYDVEILLESMKSNLSNQ